MSGIGFDPRNYLSRQSASNYARASEEVSSGRRSPRSSAAEFAIASNLRKDIAGLGQATQNLRQGSSVLQVAAGGLSQTSGILTRLKELSVQANNDLLGGVGQNAVRAEFNELVSTLDRIAGGTRFSGQPLFSQGGQASRGETPGTVVTARGLGEQAQNLNATANGFTGRLDTARSAGFLNESVSEDLNVRFEGNGQQVNVTINGQEFQADMNDIEAGGTLEFRSTQNPETRFGLELDANDVSGLQTQSGLRGALNQALGGAELNIGVSARVTNTGTHNAFSGDNLLNLEGSSGNAQGQVEAARVSGTNGDYTVELDIGGETFRGSAQTVSDGGTIELVNTNDPSSQIALNLSNDTSSITDAASFETALNDVLRPNGNGADVAIGDGAQANGFNTTQGIQGFNSAQSSGFIDGVAQELDVVRNGAGFDISLTLDSGQTFEARSVSPTADGQIRLTNSADPSAQITLDLGGDVTGLQTEAGLQGELSTALGVGDTGGPVRFRSESGFNDGQNGFEAGVNASITATGRTAEGRYAFSYDAGSGTATVTNGTDVFTAAAQGDGAQTLSFANGVSVELGDDFDAERSIGQQGFDVEQNGRGSFSVQGGSDPNSLFDVSMPDISAAGLGLTGLDPSDPSAQAAIDRALNIVNGELASIGAQQSAFETTINNNISQELGQQEALASFEDVDFVEKIIEMAAEQVRLQTQASLTAQTQRLNQQQFQRLLGGL